MTETHEDWDGGFEDSIRCPHCGEAGHYCKPNGTCLGPLLECVDSPVYLGLPVDALPSCRMKVKP